MTTDPQQRLAAALDDALPVRAWSGAGPLSERQADAILATDPQLAADIALGALLNSEDGVRVLATELSFHGCRAVGHSTVDDHARAIIERLRAALREQGGTE